MSFPAMMGPVATAGTYALSVSLHPGLPLAPHDLPTAWNLEPGVLLGLILLTAFYALGVRTLWQHAGRGRGLAGWRVTAWTVGMLTLFVALVSPVDALGSVLFSGHMLQHMLLTLVAAPLLVLGRPHIALLWALPVPARRRLGGAWRRATALRAVWRTLTLPAVVWVVHAGTTWLWHLPGPYQAALTSEPLHAAEHMSFLGTAVLFWWILPGTGPRPRLNPVAGVLYLFTFTLQGGILGALLAFAATPWYPVYAASALTWGLTPLDDQQLAGMIMWVPSGLVYVVAALVPLAIWLEAGAEPPLQEREGTALAGIANGERAEAAIRARRA